jgi:hypothetical protein
MFTGVLQPPISLFSLSYARSLPFWPLEMSNHISNEIDTKLVVKRRPAGTRQQQQRLHIRTQKKRREGSLVRVVYHAHACKGGVVICANHLNPTVWHIQWQLSFKAEMAKINFLPLMHLTLGLMVP